MKRFFNNTTIDQLLLEFGIRTSDSRLQSLQNQVASIKDENKKLDEISNRLQKESQKIEDFGKQLLTELSAGSLNANHMKELLKCSTLTHSMINQKQVMGDVGFVPKRNVKIL